MIKLTSISPRLQAKLGLTITDLPNRRETKRRIRQYLDNRKPENKCLIRVEKIRASLSPSCGWTIDRLRDWIEEMGYKIRNDDRVVLK